MNTWALVRWTLWLCATVLVIAGFERARSIANERSGLPRETFASLAKARVPIPADSLSALANRIAGADPFRLTRRPSPIAFGAAPENATPLPPKAPKPPLALSGTIGGPPWIAVMDGVPGHEQSIAVRAGDTLAGLSVRSVTHDRIVVVGFDTTWRLTVRHPWP